MEQVIFDKDGTDLLFVDRKKVQELYSRFDKYLQESHLEKDADFYKGEQNALVLLFGDKCLHDKQPSVQVEPKFKYDIGDKVIFRGKPYKINGREINFGKISYSINIPNNGYKCIFKESDLEPYTEPETKDMEEKELNLSELLKGCEGEKFYSRAYGEVTLNEIVRDDRPNSQEIKCYTSDPQSDRIWFLRNGRKHKNGEIDLYPSRALYEKYPLDPVKAWSVWASERKPKYEVRSIIEYWEVGKSSKWTSPYNIIVSSKEEAHQASEAVRECLKKFNEKNTQT